MGKELSLNYSENKIDYSSKSARLFLSVGRMDKVGPKRLLKFFTENANINPSEIGDIDIMNKFSFVNVSDDVAKLIIKKCSGKQIFGRKIRIEISKPKKRD